MVAVRSKRKQSSSTSDSPVRSSHKRKHHHHHSDKADRKKHRIHKSREEEKLHKHKKKKHRHHREELKDIVDTKLNSPQHTPPEENKSLTDLRVSSEEAKVPPQSTKQPPEHYERDDDGDQPHQNKEEIRPPQQSSLDKPSEDTKPAQDTHRAEHVEEFEHFVDTKPLLETKPLQDKKHSQGTKHSQSSKSTKPPPSTEPVQEVTNDDTKSHGMKKKRSSLNTEAAESVIFKAPTRSVVVVKSAADKKVLKIAPDLESPILPPSCLQHFVETPDATCIKEVDFTSSSSRNKSSVQTANDDDDGIEEGEILELTATHSPIVLHNPPQSHVRKLKRKSSQSLEQIEETISHSKVKKRKWKKDRDSSEKPKKHKSRTK